MNEWKEIADESDFTTTDRKCVDLGGDKQLVVFKLDDGYFCLSAWCSHQKASLAIGDLVDHQITCPLHGARFDLRSGKHLSMPAVRPVKSYETKVEGTKVLIKI